MHQLNNKKESFCNEKVFESFFKTHAKPLYNYLVIKFSDPNLADDIVQESFLKIWDSCAKIIPEKAKSYLFTTATNIGISKKRHDKVVFNYSNIKISENNNTNNESPEFILIEKEFSEKFKIVIANLPERQRTVFLLNRIEKKTYKEIAALNGVSQKAIEKLMHKAIKSIKNQLGNLKF